jgi:hypothetical protein
MGPASFRRLENSVSSDVGAHLARYPTIKIPSKVVSRHETNDANSGLCWVSSVAQRHKRCSLPNRCNELFRAWLTQLSPKPKPPQTGCPWPRLTPVVLPLRSPAVGNR